MPRLQDGRLYELRQVTRVDYEGEKYDYLYGWLGRVDKYLGLRFKPQYLESNRAFWMKHIETQNDNSHVVFGAFFEGEIIAQASIECSRQTDQSRMRNVGHWGIAVRPEFQNQGLGYALLQAMEQWARVRGFHKLAAEVVDYNEPAKTLYFRKCGYALEGRKKKEFLLDDGDYADLLVIGKILD